MNRRVFSVFNSNTANNQTQQFDSYCGEGGKNEMKFRQCSVLKRVQLTLPLIRIKNEKVFN